MRAHIGRCTSPDAATQRLLSASAHKAPERARLSNFAPRFAAEAGKRRGSVRLCATGSVSAPCPVEEARLLGWPVLFKCQGGALDLGT
ncbi:unnamed protein product [Lampetra planeri]